MLSLLLDVFIYIYVRVCMYIMHQLQDKESMFST